MVTLAMAAAPGRRQQWQWQHQWQRESQGSGGIVCEQQPRSGTVPAAPGLVIGTPCAVCLVKVKGAVYLPPPQQVSWGGHFPLVPTECQPGA